MWMFLSSVLLFAHAFTHSILLYMLTLVRSFVRSFSLADSVLLSKFWARASIDTDSVFCVYTTSILFIKNMKHFSRKVSQWWWWCEWDFCLFQFCMHLIRNHKTKCYLLLESFIKLLLWKQKKKWNEKKKLNRPKAEANDLITYCSS